MIDDQRGLGARDGRVGKIILCFVVFELFRCDHMDRPKL